MPSIQAKITKILLRLYFAGWSQGTVEKQRARQERSAKYARLPKDVVSKPISVEGIPSEWIETPNPKYGAILYLHGGAYALGSINVHRELLARLAWVTRLNILAINYRLAPEHPFPAALNDTIKAYCWLLAQGLPASKIIIAGDSAGGGLTLAAMIALRDQGQPLPAGAVTLSPWLDLALTGSSVTQKAKADPILDYKSLTMYAGYYSAGQSLTLPLLSPLYADLRRLPPTLIQVGADEILLNDSTRFAERACQAGVDVRLEMWDGLFHVFQIIPFLPETQKALQNIAAFIAETLKQKT